MLITPVYLNITNAKLTEEEVKLYAETVDEIVGIQAIELGGSKNGLQLNEAHVTRKKVLTETLKSSLVYQKYCLHFFKATTISTKSCSLAELKEALSSGRSDFLLEIIDGNHLVTALKRIHDEYPAAHSQTTQWPNSVHGNLTPEEKIYLAALINQTQSRRQSGLQGLDLVHFACIFVLPTKPATWSFADGDNVPQAG